MMLPGGMAEFAASPSLLRSDVAALIVGGGLAGGREMAGEEAEDSPAGGRAAARSPAGLHSDSMRQRHHD